MKVTVEEIANLSQTEVIIKCQKRSDKIDSLVASLRLFDKKLSVKREGRTYLVATQDIYYFECVDNKIFCNTEKEVYETNVRLYEVEKAFENTTFLRVNKYIVLNAAKIKSFKSALNGRMDAILLNGEKVEISRNYVPALKVILGGIKK